MSEEFDGLSRLQPFEPIQKPIRMGNLAVISLSDKQFLINSLNKEDKLEFETFIALLKNDHQFLMIGFTEWCMQLHKTLNTLLPNEYPKLIIKIYQEWEQELDFIKEETENSCSVVEKFLKQWHNLGVDAHSVDVFKAQISQGDLISFNEITLNSFSLLDEILNEQKVNLVDQYFTQIRLIHDCFTHLTSVFPVVVAKNISQSIAEKLIADSFSSCSFHDGLFDLAVSLTPKKLAAFFAEHLRYHFSGEGREGSVDITEENDFYQLNFTPCGTGGALRNRSPKDKLFKFKEKSNFTWGLENSVPPYCAHCAFNEITFVNKCGYPAVVTLFEKDNAKKCAWRIYKSENLIPEEFFKRIGFKKP